MTDKEKYISEKMRILVGKDGYSRPQAYQIALSMAEKEGHKAQQGVEIDNSRLKPIYNIQQGVSHPDMGNGVYIYYKDPTEQGFSPSFDREFVKQEAYRNTVLSSPAYQKYSRDKAQNIPFYQGNTRVEEPYMPTQSTSNLKPIVDIQRGVENDKLGGGSYVYYKKQSDPTFNYKTDRDFVTNEAFKNKVIGSPSYQQYSRTKGQQGYYNNNPSILNNYNYQPQNNLEQGNTSNYVIPEKPIINRGNPEQIDFIANPNYNQNPNLNYGNYKKEEPVLEDVSQETKKEANTNYYDTNRVNIMNPYNDMSLDYTMGRAGQAFGEGDYMTGAAAGALSLLKGTKNFLSAFSSAKEDKRMRQEYDDKMHENKNRFIAGQQGGKFKNSDVLAQNAITDIPQGNINLEDKEFVMRASGQIQPVVGDKHIENGKIGKGVNAQLNEGDKVLSNYMKLKPTDIKDLKERYDISLGKGVTFAEAQKKIDQKLGIKKLETEKADILEKIEKATKIKDSDTRQLSIDALNKKVGGVNEKLNTLSDLRASNFDYLFQKQESQPKKGTGSELYDKNGKEVIETNNTVAQQGGMIESLAKKHGISVERAMELMQQGGIQSGQEETQEGQTSNAQEEQGEISPEQIIQAFAELTQQDPQQIVAQLQKMQPEEQKQALGQMMQSLQQGQQNPQEEQAEGQMSNQQEEQMEVAQQGTRIASKYEDPKLYKKQEPIDNQWQSFGELLKKNPKEAMSNMKELHPELYSKYFKDGEVPSYENIRKFQEGINDKYSAIRSDYVKEYGKESEQVKQLDIYIEKDKFLPTRKEYDEAQDRIVNKEIRGVDSYLGNWTATRPNFAIDVLPKEDLEKVRKEGINTATQLKSKYPDLYSKYVEPKGLTSDFWLGEIKEPAKKEDDYTATTQDQKEVVARDRVKNILPNFASYIPLFSPMQSIAKESIAIPRLEPIKATPEPMLAEQERQRQADVARVEQSGMSPQQQEAILAQGLASSQMASNDAISKVEQWNAQNQFATDQYNVGAQTKEDIMNSQYRQDYQNKAFQTIANQEADIRNQYRTNFLQNQANSNRVIDMNRANALNDQFAITPDGIVALNNKPYDIGYSNMPTKAQLEKMTPSQRIAFQKALVKNYEASLSK